MYAQAVGNIILGSLAIISNLILICAFLSNKRRRGTYPLLLTMAFGDALNGLAFLGYGSNRLLKQLLNDTHPTSPSVCLSTVYPIVTPLSQIIIAFTTLFLAVDRFLGMRLPFFYYINIRPVKYYPYLGLIILAASVFTGIGMYEYTHILDRLPWHCGTPDAVSDVYNNIRFGAAAFGGILAAAIYCAALMPSLYRISKSKEDSAWTGAKTLLDEPRQQCCLPPDAFLRRQSKLTRDVSFVMLSTLLLYAIPMFNYWLHFGLKMRLAVLLKISPYAGWLTAVHSSLNVVLLCFMSQDIRIILMKTILPACCWRKNIRASNTSSRSKKSWSCDRPT